MRSRKPSGYTLFALFIFLVVLVVAAGWTLHVLNFPPITGRVTSKTHHPAYYPATSSTPEVFVLAITDDSGNRCATWRVSEDRWNLYDVGDEVNWFPKWKEDVE